MLELDSFPCRGVLAIHLGEEVMVGLESRCVHDGLLRWEMVCLSDARMFSKYYSQTN